jgi:hypothetical protein
MFTTREGGNLLKIGIKEKGFEPVSFPVGENLDAPYLYTNLYYSPLRQKLFALIYKQITDVGSGNEVEVSIFSLDYPPAPIVSLNQSPALDNQPESNRLWLIFLIPGFLLLIIVSFVLWRKQSKKSVDIQMPAKEDSKETTS